MNDALLSGSVDFIAAGPPAFITLWDRTRGSADVRGVAAMSSLPMYLNTTNPALTSIDDLTATDKIAVTAVKVSIPSINMQMYAAERHGAAEAFRFDRYTVTMTHRGCADRAALGLQPDQRALHVAAVPSARDQGPARAHAAEHRRHHGRRDDVHDAVDDGAVSRGEPGRVRGRARGARGSRTSSSAATRAPPPRSCSRRNRPPASPSRSSSRSCATPTSASRRRPRTPRSTPSSCTRSARSRTGRARGAICSSPRSTARPAPDTRSGVRQTGGVTVAWTTTSSSTPPASAALRRRPRVPAPRAATASVRASPRDRGPRWQDRRRDLRCRAYRGTH